MSLSMSLGLTLGRPTAAGDATPPATTTQTLSHNGASATVTGVVSNGSFMDGTPWAMVSGTPQITAFTPASAQLSRTHAETADLPSSPTAAWGNGLAFNPGATPSGTTIAEKQAVNNGVTANATQGWDELRVKSYTTPYDVTKNIDPGRTGSAVSAAPGVYVKGISRTSETINSEGEGAVGAFGILTVLASAPPANAFRPPAALGADGPILTALDVNLARLQNLPISGYAGDNLPSAAQALAMLSAGAGIETDTTAVRAENVLDFPGGDPTFSEVGAFNWSTYRGQTNKMYANLILLLQYDHWSASEKQDIAYALIQIAIDIAGRAKTGGVWVDDGGHCLRKFLVAFAARLTDHALFTDVLSYTTTEATFGDPGAVSIWGDDRQIFTIASNHIGRVDRKLVYTPGQLGDPEYSSAAVSVNPTNDLQFHNDLGVIFTDGDIANARPQYRYITASAAIPAALALRMMGAASLFDNQTWFDYQDRHMSLRVARGVNLTPDATDHDANDVSEVTLWAWEEERAGLGGVWTPSMFIAAVLGQSQPAYLFQPAYGNFTNPSVPSAANMEVYFQSDAGAITVADVTTANLTSNAVNPVMGAWSAWFDFMAPGREFVIADMAHQGTGRDQLFDDALTGRDFGDLAAMVTRLETDHDSPDLIVESWMANDNSIAKTIQSSYAPGLMGEFWNEDALTLGNSQGDYDVDNILWDVTAATSAKGRGVFTRDDTKWSVVGWQTQNANADPERANFSEGVTQDRLDAPARASLSELFNDARVQTFAGYDGFSSHIALMTDGDILDGSEESGTHPSIQNPDGLILMGWPFAASILRHAGVSIHEPRITGVKADSPIDGSYMDVEVDLANGGTLTTLRELRSTAAPVTPSPHQQDVVGFEIQRSGGARRPVFLTTETGEPVAHRGTVTIEYDGSTTPVPSGKARGKGVIRITPTTAFGSGDSVEFLRGDAGALLLNDRDTANRIYLDMPIEHVPEFYDASATYPMEGFAVRPQPATLASVVPAPSFAARSARFTGSGDDDQNIEKTLSGKAGGDGLLSMWIKNDDVSWNDSNYLRHLFDFRQSPGGASVFYCRANSGSRLEIVLGDGGENTPSDLLTGFSIGSWYHILMSWAEDGARVVYVNGVQQVNRSIGTIDLKTNNLFTSAISSAAPSQDWRRWAGDIGHFYLNMDETLDITVQANREKFALSGNPVNLGADGSLPTGTAPRFYFDGDAPAWGNQGSNGAWTATGTLTAGGVPSY